MAENTSQVVEFNKEDDVALEIMERLIGNSTKANQLDVISIVGMAGLGKTTLALKVYHNDSIAHHFYIRSWITVSQSYQKRDLLFGILSTLYTQLNIFDKYHKMSDEMLIEVVYKSLKGNRYLIVLDDIWNIQAWDDLKICFPNDKNGSRIIFTSRIKDVSLHAKPNSIPYELRFLSKEESWDLLKEKIFHTEICPPELMEVGMEIAKKCRGLPLAIVVIGGLLAKIEKNIHQWNKVAGSMGSYINASDPKQCIETLELSYNHLPNHLKPLFLYLGAFPEDYEIPVFKLIWLWIVEGFVQENGDETLEDIAMDYLMDLIGRSLILISKRSSNGEVKSCRVHDLLRDLCLIKAEEENFMKIIDRLEQVSTALANNVCRLSINRCSHRYFPYEHYPNTSSILIHGTCSPSWGCHMSLSLEHFGLLKVLDLKDARYRVFPSEIKHLVHLRYLALQQLSNEIAGSIFQLRNLETLIFFESERKKSTKVDISSMIKLRHLRIINPWPEGHIEVMLDGSSLLVDLQTICTPWFTCENYDDSLKSTPNLRQLRCTFSNSSIFSSSCSLEFLVKLEKLRMGYHGLPSMIRWLDLPSSLKKITLSHFRFDWRYFSKLSKLPKLEVLKLLLHAFRGEQWDTSSEESNLQFPKLKFLKFDTLNIVEWNASKDHFPSLQRLVVKCCLQLKEIPLEIGDISTLKTIELKWCSRSAAESVRRILEEQQGVGNEQLKIFIHPPNS